MEKSIEEYDDGSTVHLDSYTAGGGKDGSWSRLSLRFDTPPGVGDVAAWFGRSAVRTYTADDVWKRPTLTRLVVNIFAIMGAVSLLLLGAASAGWLRIK